MRWEDVRGVTVDRDVPYRETPDGTLRLDVYRRRDGDDGGRPAVVYVHGGGWEFGEKGELARAALDLADAGYVVVDANYRLTDAATFPAQIRDVEAAIAWTRDHAADLGVDADRVATMGHSAGAHLAALAGVSGEDAFDGQRDDADDRSAPESDRTASAAVDAVVGISGVYDLTAADDEPDIYRQLFGGTSAEYPELYRRASPFRSASADAPPTLLVHGTEDEVVPMAQSVRYRDRLTDLGVDADLFVAEGGDHMVPFRNEWYDEIAERCVEFFDEHL